MRPSIVALAMTLCVVSAGAAVPLEQAAAQPSFDELIQTIRADNAYERANAIGPLSRIDDPRVVPALVALLGDENETVRTYAAQQLARLADRRSADALAAVLSDSNGNVRRYAAEGLASVGRERHVPALVASVMSHLPSSDPSVAGSWYCVAALEAIGKLSSKAPRDVVGLLERISTPGYTANEDWWRLLESVAGCLGQIRDKAAYEPLERARAALETGHQDYKTWYAVRKALAAIDPQNMAFDRPAADILYSERPFKGDNETIRQQWVLPVVQLGEEAIYDLQWMLEFESERDRRCVTIAIESLGDIGAGRAAEVLRGYIEKQSSLSEEARRQKRPALRAALPALLKAEPNEATAEEIALACQSLDDFEQEHLPYDVSRAPSDKIPLNIKLAFYRAALLSKAKPEPRIGSGGCAVGAARLLGQLGGDQAGQILSLVMLNPPDATRAECSAQALGTIQNYDAVPALVRALTEPKARAGTIAQALGTIADRRAVTVLKDAARRSDLTEWDRLWTAAALARLGEDYANNAKVVREALPDSLEQAEWLHDDESIRAIVALADGEAPVSDHAVRTLEAIGTDRAFAALTGRIDLEKIADPQRLERLSGVAARMAAKLGDPSKEHWTAVTTVTAAISGWFTISHAAQPAPEGRSSFETVVQNPVLERKVWIAEANRRLDLAASGKAEPYQYHIPGIALSGIQMLFDLELVPTLERIAKESDSTVELNGKHGIVKYYDSRSLAAGILAEGTGLPYTFVDVDGRTHPGGWNPSQDE